MIAPHEEHEYFQWFLREEALEWQSLQESYKDILQQIPEAEGLREFHSLLGKNLPTSSGK